VPARSPADGKALELRGKGRSFATIAKLLGLENADAANLAFNRALRARPAAEQKLLRKQEQVRLDALAERVRTRPNLSEQEVGRRLRTISRLRTELAAD
jgi:hypothetical protein